MFTLKELPFLKSVRLDQRIGGMLRTNDWCASEHLTSHLGFSSAVQPAPGPDSPPASPARTVSAPALTTSAGQDAMMVAADPDPAGLSTPGAPAVLDEPMDIAVAHPMAETKVVEECGRSEKEADRIRRALA